MGSTLAILLFLGSVAGGQASETEVTQAGDQQSDAFAAERRVIHYIKENLEPGRPVILSHLYNDVCTSPEERAGLSRLNNAFFRLPLFLVQYQAQEGNLPTLEEIAGQFNFYGPEEADVVLSVMESDPRVPKFLTRDPATGALLDLDVEKIRHDPRFNTVLERDLAWEGRVLPDVGGEGFDGSQIRLSEVGEKAVLLYVWFTDCPPCVRMAPELAALQKDFGERGFAVVGANADRVLQLPYTDEDRAKYVEAHSINFPNFHLSPENRDALGNVNIFPTMFLLGADRVIVRYYVSYQGRNVIAPDIEALLSPGDSRSD